MTTADHGSAARAVPSVDAGTDLDREVAGALSHRAEFWTRALRAWDVAFYLGVTIAGVAFVLAHGWTAGSALSLGLLAALVLAYVGIGRQAAVRGDNRLATAYLVVLIVVTIALVRAESTATITLFIAYSQIWFFAATRRGGVLACSLLTIGVFGVLILQNPDDSVAEIVVEGSLALGFAVLLGLWVTRVAEQSEERAELIARLEAAQAELGRSHHAEGVAAERERMAREIHDTLAQGFTSIVMLSQTASAEVRRGDAERAAERIDLVERVARDNLAEARALVAAFAPVGLQGSTLGEALERLATRFEQETGVLVEVLLPDDAGAAPAIGREQEVVLLRAAQEALSNVRRHAAAQHVQLVLGGSADQVHLEVVDDGRGIDADVRTGFGLRGMRERVTSGGGELAVTSGAQGGTRVRVTLPSDDAPAEPTSSDVLNDQECS